MLAIRDQDWNEGRGTENCVLVNMSLSVLTTQLYKLCVHITLKKIKKKSSFKKTEQTQSRKQLENQFPFTESFSSQMLSVSLRLCRKRN